MPSNPIQQRIEMMAEKWEDIKKKKDARIIHIRCQPGEDDMVDTFFSYMVGTDSLGNDIAFHFETPCTDLKNFGNQLLNELDQYIYIWNNTGNQPGIPFVAVDWISNRQLTPDNTVLFIKNFNALAEKLNLPDGICLVAIIKKTAEVKNLISWLKSALDAGPSQKVRILLYDRFDRPFMDELLHSPLAPLVATLPVNLDMPKAMEQIAAMGDPNDPATEYRQCFVKMMNAMAAGNETRSEACGQECLALAMKNLSRDPYWITQVVMVYIALANDKIRYKNKEKVNEYADKAVETAEASKNYFGNELAAHLLAQAMMFRGTIRFMYHRYPESHADYRIAFDFYESLGLVALAIEASRMCGESALKINQKEEAAKVLAQGARMAKRMEPMAVIASTHAGILELLLNMKYETAISMEEMDEIARPVYGEDWIRAVGNWKKVPDREQMKRWEEQPA
ncbi:MAG: hypothetical protein IPI66_07585 [Chitinophagaceae bacterium]|nr:hypothetical protein [Chitinophagaceae bacterium]